jgi:hypothetical protein
VGKYLGSQRSRTDSMGGQPFGLNRGLTRTTYDAVYQPATGDLMTPVGCAVQNSGTAVVWSAANRLQAVRFIAPKKGTIVDISFFIVTTSTGSYDIGIYDTGDTTAAVRTKLYSTGSTSIAGAANAWVSNNPNLAVRAGQHIDAAMSCNDGTTATFAKYGNMNNTAQSQLPSGYLGTSYVTSAAAKLCWQVASTYPIPSTVAEASCANTTLTPLIIMRIQ